MNRRSFLAGAGAAVVVGPALAKAALAAPATVMTEAWGYGPAMLALPDLTATEVLRRQQLYMRDYLTKLDTNILDCINWDAVDAALIKASGGDV